MSGYDITSSYLSPRLILRFIAFCHGIRKVQNGTIRSYLAAIRFFRLKAGFTDPFLNANGSIIPQIRMALRGTRRLCTKRTKQCKPITIDLLTKLIFELQKGAFNPYVDTLMQAAVTTAFWGFFRSGELFPDKFSPQLNITLDDIELGTSKAIIHLKTSKSDVERKGVEIRLFKTETPFCAVKALNSFLRMRTDHAVNSPFFCLANGQPFTRKSFVKNLRHLLLRLGISPNSYSGHSMRVGAATSAAAAGVPDHLIQALGRWSSLSYLRYIRISNDILQQACDKIIKLST